MGSPGLFATPAMEQIHTPRPVNEQLQMFRSTLEMQVLETRNMLTQQQVALNSLADTLKAMQDDLKSRNEVRPSTGSSENTGNVNKSKPK